MMMVNEQWYERKEISFWIVGISDYFDDNRNNNNIFSGKIIIDYV